MEVYKIDIKLVEIEIHSFCNRSCDWCPNKFIDRKNKIPMSDEVYFKIIDGLRKISYDGYITYSRYNEPLYDIPLLKKRIYQAKQVLPYAKIITNTNGDYLDNLDDLTMIDELTIMDYDGKGDLYILNKLKSLGAIILNHSKKGILAEYKTLKIMFHNFWKDVELSNRGGSLEIKNPIRKTPCYEPSYFVGVDYDGNIVPCCNIRSDYHHKRLILGNLEDDDFLDIINNSKSKSFRKNAALCDFDDVCVNCNNQGGRYTSPKSSIFYK